jgi:rifampin ADP-ribosylating transferase
MNNDEWKPVTFANCKQLPGPFYHGTRVNLAVGDVLSPGHPSNYDQGRKLHHIYFSANLEPAIWGAELSMALSGTKGRGHIYIVEPLGLFEDDPNLTNKRFPGNPTKSYRSRDPLKIVGKVDDWQGHPIEAIDRMLESLRDLTRRGLNVIED